MEAWLVVFCDSWESSNMFSNSDTPFGRLPPRGVTYSGCGYSAAFSIPRTHGVREFAVFVPSRRNAHAQIMDAVQTDSQFRIREMHIFGMAGAT